MTTVGTTYEPVPLVGSMDVSLAGLRDQIAAWASSPPIADLTAAETGRATGTLQERLAYLDGLSAAAWDFRARASAAGKIAERNQVNVSIPPEREAPVLAAADALGMVRAAAPRYTTYDHVLSLGGLVRACLWRTQYAAYLLRTHIDSPAVAALTAFRRLARNESNPDQDEPTLLTEAGLPIRDYEAEVMEDALTSEFGLDGLVVTSSGAGDHDADRFKVAVGKAEGPTVTLVAAPDPRSEYRADTATTMRYWASNVADLKPDQRILNITSSIYVPFQHAAAVQHLVLPYGVEVDTVGIDHDAIRPIPHPQVFTGVNYLQEIRSTVRAYRSLLDAVEKQAGTS